MGFFDGRKGLHDGVRLSTARQYIEWVREMTKDFLEDQSKWHANHSRSEYLFKDKDGDKHFT
jgi:hypothetical protein